MLGLVLLTVCASGFYIAALRASGRVPVLALAREVPAGHVLTGADLRVVRVASGNDVATVAASRSSSVIGSTLAWPRPAGALLAPADLGAPSKWPPAGMAIVAVALKAGTFPPGLSSGAHVGALLTSSSMADGTPASNATNDAQGSDASNGSPSDATHRTDSTGGSSWLPGLVVSVDDGGTDGSMTVVSLLMETAAASRVGAAAGGPASSGSASVSLLQLASGTVGKR